MHKPFLVVCIIIYVYISIFIIAIQIHLLPFKLFEWLVDIQFRASWNHIMHNVSSITNYMDGPVNKESINIKIIKLKLIFITIQGKNAYHALCEIPL